MPSKLATEARNGATVVGRCVGGGGSGGDGDIYEETALVPDTVENGNVAGADDFVPLLIWCVVQANVPNLCTNCEFIRAFHDPEMLKAMSGYYLTSLCSAIAFIAKLEPDQLDIDPFLFQTLFSSALNRIGDSDFPDADV